MPVAVAVAEVHRALGADADGGIAGVEVAL
jgi:hypothetical protein